ncbi:OPT oligopeptide transporter protein-domain-containing protein [Leptodontidium sp. MPI-SDFR-AT-0119]|nr:OPT oligopeptide transporter protein-domain-containing protein [Leptodontidium sp. MPI-SDFR-AT-0119]
MDVEIQPKAEDTADSISIKIDSAGHEILDLFEPFPPQPGEIQENPRVLTFRAVIVGSLLGCLVTASNTYMGLKTAFGFGAGLFGSLLGFIILKSISKAVPEHFPILGGYFGPRENAIFQTSAATAGGLSFIFISGIPALYQLGLMEGSPQNNYWKLVTFAAVSAYYGLAFSAPMRNFFVKSVAREMNLTFPSATAVALTIRAIHTTAGGSDEAKKKVRALCYAFVVALVLRVVSQYANGIIWDWHVFTWIFVWGKYHNAALAAESWGWFIEWTPAFLGTGMLVGLNVAYSYLLGAVLAWGIIGPALVHQGLAVGLKPFVGTKWASYTIYTSLVSKDLINKPSPRYWLLWPGIMIMLCASLAELFVQYRIIGRGFMTGVKSVKESIAGIREKRLNFSPFTSVRLNGEGEKILWWMWAPETIVIAVLTCVILSLQYQMDIQTSIVSLLFGVILSFLSIQVAGVIDNVPTTAISKATQLILAGVTKGHYTIPTAQRINISGAQIAGGAAYAATELMADFRVGFLLGTPIVQQFIAQILGNIFAIFLSPAVFILFTKAYPCILDTTIDTCGFAVPAASAWKSIAIAVTSPTLPIPLESGICAIVLGIFSIVLVVIRHFYLVGSRAKYVPYVPNMSVVGLSMILPATCYNIAIAIGATFAYFWMKKYPVSANMYIYALAAGMIAGEGIGGVVNAIIQLAGVSGLKYGSNVGCPLNKC